MLSRRGQMSPSREVKTLANGAVPDAFCCGVLANLRLRLEHKLDLERIAEIRDLRSSEF